MCAKILGDSGTAASSSTAGILNHDGATNVHPPGGRSSSCTGSGARARSSSCTGSGTRTGSGACARAGTGTGTGARARARSSSGARAPRGPPNRGMVKDCQRC